MNNGSSRKNNADPLLFSCNDDVDSEFDGLITTEDNDSFSNINLDPLEPEDVGHWLQNSSMSQLSTAVDTDHDGSLCEGNLLPVNPNSVLQPSQPPQEPLEDINTVNSAAMRLHANCSSSLGTVKTVNHIAVPQTQQQIQHIQIVAIPVTASSGNSSSPMKANTIILDSNTGTFSVAGTAYIASPQKLQTISSSDQTTRSDLTPSQSSPVLVGHLQNRVRPTQTTVSSKRPVTMALGSPLKHTNIVPHQSQSHRRDSEHTVTNYHQRYAIKHEDKVYPKPVYSYSCLIALALKNSKTGNLPVNEIYNFMCENFPFFKTAPDGWKNSVRHNLSLNKCFAKVDNPKLSSGAKKGCLWAMNPAKVKKMEDEITKWRKKDPTNLLSSMAYPENLEAIEKGQAGLPFHEDYDSDSEENEPSPPPPPSTPLKLEMTSTPQKQISVSLSELAASPMTQTDLDQEYAAHAIQWGIHETDLDDIQIDLLTSSPLSTSPISSQASPLPHTPSRSVVKRGPAPVYHGSCLSSSPARLFVNATPSSVQTNFLGVASPRTLSALN